MINKLPRAIVLANTFKYKQMKQLVLLKTEMENKNIDKILIEKFINEQYDIIIDKYNRRINNYNQKNL